MPQGPGLVPLGQIPDSARVQNAPPHAEARVERRSDVATLVQFLPQPRRLQRLLVACRVDPYTQQLLINGFTAAFAVLHQVTLAR